MSHQSNGFLKRSINSNIEIHIQHSSTG